MKSTQEHDQTRELAGQTAVIVGGAGGIGEASARELAGRGAHVVIADRDSAAADSVAESLGDQAMSVSFDVTNSQQVEDAFERVFAARGSVEILVNCAGFTIDGPLVKMADDDWHKVLNVCLFGTFLTCRAAAPAMIDAGYGRIINISSRAYLGNPGQANYASAKAGVVGLTKALSKELGPKGITANAIAPGLVETKLLQSHPKYEAIRDRALAANTIKRLGTVEDVAGGVAFYASPHSGFVSGDVMHLSGGRFS